MLLHARFVILFSTRFESSIFECQNHDVEAYRATVKKQIKEWHTTVSGRKNQEWLIVHVVRPDQSTAQGRLFQMKASVLDKVKADFNVDKKDRSVTMDANMPLRF